MLQTITSNQESEAIAEVFWRAFITLSKVQQQAVLERLVEAGQAQPMARSAQKSIINERAETVELILDRLQGHGRGEHLTEKLLQSRSEDRDPDRRDNEQRLSA